MAFFLSNYVFPTRYSLGITQIQGAQTRLPTLILPCITPCIFTVYSLWTLHYGKKTLKYIKLLKLFVSNVEHLVFTLAKMKKLKKESFFHDSMSSISAFWLKIILRNLSSTSVAAANSEACYNCTLRTRHFYNH